MGRCFGLALNQRLQRLNREEIVIFDELVKRLAGVATAVEPSRSWPLNARMNTEMAKAFSRADERTQKVVAEVQEVVREVGRSPAQVSLAWLRQRSVPVIPIVGARNLDQFKDNLACLDLTLGESQVSRLDAASDVELGFPHDFYAKDMVKGLIYGGLRDKIDV